MLLFREQYLVTVFLDIKNSLLLLTLIPSSDIQRVSLDSFALYCELWIVGFYLISPTKSKDTPMESKFVFL